MNRNNQKKKKTAKRKLNVGEGFCSLEAEEEKPRDWEARFLVVFASILLIIVTLYWFTHQDSDGIGRISEVAIYVIFAATGWALQNSAKGQ